MLIYNSIQLVLLLLLGSATLYILIFSVAGLFYKEQVYTASDEMKKIAVLIPGYKEDEVILEVAESALQQNYPSGDFDVIIIADSFQKETITALKKLPIKLIEVSFDKSTKSKALNSAMALLPEEYDIAVILDADNLMEQDFLTKVNAAFSKETVAIQGHRTAKNQNNSWAILDAVSEEINNHIFRKGHRVLGLSSAIIGSGMAFKYNYFKSLMLEATAVGGFDKEIELKMLKEGHRIQYLHDAIVYDEKIQKSEVFGNQRRRWLSAQLHYFRKDFLNAFRDLLLKGNIDYFDKAIQFIQPPRILLLGSLMLLTTLFIFSNYLLQNNSVLSLSWMIISAACIFSLIISIPRHFFNVRTLTALVNLPGGMLLMLRSLMRIKGANKQFIHTRHTANSK